GTRRVQPGRRGQPLLDRPTPRLVAEATRRPVASRDASDTRLPRASAVGAGVPAGGDDSGEERGLEGGGVHADPLVRVVQDGACRGDGCWWGSGAGAGGRGVHAGGAGAAGGT